jgi:hypothetical protein
MIVGSTYETSIETAAGSVQVVVSHLWKWHLRTPELPRRSFRGRSYEEAEARLLEALAKRVRTFAPGSGDVVSSAHE